MRYSALPPSAMRPTIIAFLTTLITVVGPFASDSYLPSLPSMTHVFNTTSHMMQLTITFYFLGLSLSQLVYGPLSDRYGRRLIVLSGLGICLFGSLLCAFAPTAKLLIFARLLQGIGAGVTSALYRAIIRDIFHGAQLAKVIAYLGMGFAIVPAAAPIIGGYIETAFGWRANFIFLLFVIAAIWLIIWYFLPETNLKLNSHATEMKVIWKNYKTLLTSKIFVGFTLCSSLAYAGIIAYLTTSPFLFQNILKLNAVQYGWLAIFITCSIIIGQFINSRLITTIGMIKTLSLGATIILLSGLLLLITGLHGMLNVPIVIFPICTFSIAATFVFVNAMAGALTPFANIAGAAGAMYGCLQVITSFFSSLLVAGLHSRNQMVLAGIFIFLGVCMLSIYKLLLAEAKLSLPK